MWQGRVLLISLAFFSNLVPCQPCTCSRVPAPQCGSPSKARALAPASAGAGRGSRGECLAQSIQESFIWAHFYKCIAWDTQRRECHRFTFRIMSLWFDEVSFLGRTLWKIHLGDSSLVRVCSVSLSFIL